MMEKLHSKLCRMRGEEQGFGEQVGDLEGSGSPSSLESPYPLGL